MTDIREIITEADDIHATAVRAADTARNETFTAAAVANGLDRSQEFRGAPMPGLLHHLGKSVFDRSAYNQFLNFTTYESFIEDLERTQQEKGDRVPVLLVAYTDANLDMECSPTGRDTSLTLIESGSLAVTSTVKPLDDPVTMFKRQLSLDAETVIIDSDIMAGEFDPKAQLEVTQSDGLILFGAHERKSETELPSDGPASYISRVGPASTHAIGWDSIASMLTHLAGPFGNYGEDCRPDASPPAKYQAYFDALTDAHTLTEKEKIHAAKISELVAACATRAVLLAD